MSTCNNCGIDTLKICLNEMNMIELVKWRRITQVVVGKSKDGSDKKSPKVEYMETPPSVMIEYMKPKLRYFVTHNFISQWQELQFKNLLRNLPSHTVLSCIDFIENYSMKVQNEVQSMHWHSSQVTILVHITYFRNPEYNAEDSESKEILKEVHYYVSDEKEHDSIFVQHAFRLH
jgi:hypothetical protein